MTPQTFIANLTAKVEPLTKELCELYWEFAITGKEEIAKQMAEKEKAQKLLYSNPKELAQLKQWKADGISDPSLARQVELLILDYTANQLDEKTIADLVERQTEIENIFNNFRAELDGQPMTNNDLKELLKTERDNGRRQKIWEAAKQIGPEVEGKIRELARRKNAAAKKLGFANSFAMGLELQELDSRWLFATFARLKTETEPVFQGKIAGLHKKLADRYGIEPSAIRPWHYEDFFSQELPAHGSLNLDPFFQKADIPKICRTYYEGVGLPIADVLNQSDLFEKKGKSQHAFCLCVDRGQDIRILANIRPNKYWMRTMLHELGHASYDKYIDMTLPFFLRDAAHLLTTEATALLLEQMAYDPDWLAAMGLATPAQTKQQREGLFETLALGKLISVRWMMVVTHFERALYENPDQDLNSLWWKLVKEYQRIEKPEGRSAPDWATKIHIATAPVYYQNYLLGELFAAQIKEMLTAEADGFIDNPKIGKILSEKLFAMGSKLPWHTLVPHVTGRPLGTESFVKQFCS